MSTSRGAPPTLSPRDAAIYAVLRWIAGLVWGLTPLANTFMTVWLPWVGVKDIDATAYPVAITVFSLGILIPALIRWSADRPTNLRSVGDAFGVMWVVGPLWLLLVPPKADFWYRFVVTVATALKVYAFVRFYGWVLPAAVRPLESELPGRRADQQGGG